MGSELLLRCYSQDFSGQHYSKDAHIHVQHCDNCQRTGTIVKRHEMPLRNIQEIEIFDCWGIDFIAPLPSSFSNEYICWLWNMSHVGWKQFQLRKQMQKQ